MTALELVPVIRDTARAFVGRHHRHNLPPRGAIFYIGVADQLGELRGVAIVGRPVSRHLDDGATLEVLRVCTDGAPNACSMLYGASARIARELGYRRLYTYTLETEPGTSLRAAGWTRDADLKARTDTWDTPIRPRHQLDLFGHDRRPPGAKVRWVRQLRPTKDPPE